MSAILDIRVTQNEYLVRLTIHFRWKPISSVNLIIFIALKLSHGKLNCVVEGISHSPIQCVVQSLFTV